MSRTLNKLRFEFLFQSCKRSIDSFDGERMNRSEFSFWAEIRHLFKRFNAWLYLNEFEYEGPFPVIFEFFKFRFLVFPLLYHGPSNFRTQSKIWKIWADPRIEVQNLKNLSGPDTIRETLKIEIEKFWKSHKRGLRTRIHLDIVSH